MVETSGFGRRRASGTFDNRKIFRANTGAGCALFTGTTCSLMKQIKLSGREKAVLRYMDWATGSKGTELQEATKLDADDLVSVLNGLMAVGYVEMQPYADQTELATYAEKIFEVNPGYALELKEAMARY
jgi:hypothetical protein